MDFPLLDGLGLFPSRCKTFAFPADDPILPFLGQNPAGGGRGLVAWDPQGLCGA